jgi:hypothetical protein
MIESTCTTERPCAPCFADQGECIGPAPVAHAPYGEGQDQPYPEDPTMDGSTLKFRPLEHGAVCEPQAIEVTDAEGRVAIFVRSDCLPG